MKHTIIFLFFVSALFHRCWAQQVNYVENGLDVVTVGGLVQPDDVFLTTPRKSAHTETTFKKNGIVIKKINYTTDEQGSRISSASGKPSKSKHFFIFGSSDVFGYGLDDSETISHFVNSKSKIYESVPIAFFAWGPQHLFLKAQSEDFSSISKYKTGSAVIIANDSNADRFFGRYKSLYYTAEFPLVEEDSLGIFKHRGRIDENSGIIKRMTIKYCLPIMVCKAFLNKIFEVTDIAGHATLARLYDAVLLEYKKKYVVENFVLVWTGSPKEYEKVKQVSQIPTFYFTDYEKGPEFHPTAKGAKEIADFLFKQNILK